MPGTTFLPTSIAHAVRLASTRHETGLEYPVRPQKVLEVFRAEAFVVRVQVGGREIRTTLEHPFWVAGMGWTAAGELKPGHLLSSHDGNWLPVEAVTLTAEQVPVYNIRVEEDHTYFVGSDEWGFSVWAHNACIYRALTPEDLEYHNDWLRMMPKGKGGSITDHVQGYPTKYLSASETFAGTFRFRRESGVAVLDTDILLRTGSGIVPHANVLADVSRHGRPLDVTNVTTAQEILITGGIDPTAVIEIIWPDDPRYGRP
jgi:hypothetical protein